MTGFYALSALQSSFVQLWCFLLCCGNILCMLYSGMLKKFLYAVFTVIPFAAAFFIWQLAFDVSLQFRQGEIFSGAIRLFATYPLYFFAVLLVLLTAVPVFLFCHIIRYGRRHITPETIKLCGDQIPCGVCYWHNSGYVTFSNHCMEELCVSLTGQSLLNGEQFYESLPGSIVSVGEKVWNFTHRLTTLEQEPIHELIAVDVTEKYARIREMETGNARLAQMNEEMQAYRLSIDDTVRRQELLQARMNIHDEMNRIMLSTVAADPENPEELNRVLSLWQQNALLLCRENGAHTAEDSFKRLRELADALNISLLWPDSLPEALTAEQEELLYSAAQEALINAAKHADAHKLEAEFTITQDSILCILRNDGRLPAGEVHFAGGLKNLQRLAAKQEADVAVRVQDDFALCLVFPMKTKN